MTLDFSDCMRAERGTVKWFSKESGYGFIVGTDDADRYFHVTDIVGAKLPSNGDIVDFIDGRNKKGACAKQVKIISVATPSPTTAKKATDSVKCRICKKNIVPRIITGPPVISGQRWTPVPIKSVCPFCGADYEVFERKVFSSTLSMIGAIISALIIFFVFMSMQH